MVAWVTMLGACTPAEVQLQSPQWSATTPEETRAELRYVEDLARESGFQDSWFGHLKRGRALMGADFNNDGLLDFYIGNTNDPSFVIVNVTEPDGPIRFDIEAPIATEGLFWGGSAADWNNDGTTDLFVAAGSSLRMSPDQLWTNLDPTSLTFEDQAIEAGVFGLMVPGRDRAVPQPSSGAHWIDLDADGWLDLSVTSNLNLWPQPIEEERPEWSRSRLYRNEQDGTFTEIGLAAGLPGCNWCQHASWLDVDNDGDPDYFENHYGYRTERDQDNILWRNLYMETGEIRFEDATDALSLPGTNLHKPAKSFTSAVADFNNDGWDDLLVFVRPPEPQGSAHGTDGHAMFINVEGTGFVEVSAHTGVNAEFINWTRDHADEGVMGSQVGDLNVDGIPDVFIGQGRPQDGTQNLLMVSTGMALVEIPDVGEVWVPQYTSWTDDIDFPSERPEGYARPWPPFPYRTHGSVIADVDRDGIPELAISNGGAAASPEVVQEPNRLFRFELDDTFRRSWLVVQPRGDGVRINRTGIGAKVHAQVTDSDLGVSWDVWGTVHSTGGYSGNQALEVFLGLGSADVLDALEITWNDGTVDAYPDVVLDSVVTLSPLD